jgi:hypothetical protein
VAASANEDSQLMIIAGGVLGLIVVIFLLTLKR